MHDYPVASEIGSYVIHLIIRVIFGSDRYFV